MNLCPVLFAACVGVFASVPVNGDDLKDLRERWVQGDWAYVAEHAPELRSKPYGRTMEIDYMLGTALCRLPDEQLQKTGCKFLKWSLSRYDDIPTDTRKTFTQEADMCGATPRESPIRVARATPTADGKGAGINVSMKTESRVSDDAVVKYASVQKLDMPIEILRSRQVEIGSRERAEGVATGLLSGALRMQGEITASDAFALVDCDARMNGLEVLNRLDKYSDFFAREFDITPPTVVTTVYMFPDRRQFQAAAERLHGLGLPDECIGYSHRDDMSVLAWTGPKADGTLYHELFHLWVRSNFGDCPPWLDEGLAALYEVSELRGNDVVGLDNWRREHLGYRGGDAVNLKTLIGTSWSSLDALDRPGDMRDNSSRAVVYATARYFMLYLQQEKKLGEVYKALQARTPGDMTDTPEQDAIATVERVLGVPLSEVDAKFRQWLRDSFPWSTSAPNHEINNRPMNEATGR